MARVAIKPGALQPGDHIWTGVSWGVTITELPEKRQNKRGTSHRGVYYRVIGEFATGGKFTKLYSANERGLSKEVKEDGKDS